MRLHTPDSREVWLSLGCVWMQFLEKEKANAMCAHMGPECLCTRVCMFAAGYCCTYVGTHITVPHLESVCTILCNLISTAVTTMMCVCVCVFKMHRWLVPIYSLKVCVVEKNICTHKQVQQKTGRIICDDCSEMWPRLLKMWGICVFVNNQILKPHKYGIFEFY